MTKTLAILVDGSNLYAANKALGLTTDYKKLLTYFGGTVLRAAYFTALPPDGETSSLRPMVDWLEYNRWTVYQKEWKKFLDPVTGQEKVKGNMDIEMSVIAMELAPDITDLVLVTGDGDFRFLVEAVQRTHNVVVTVVSTLHSRPPMVADILRRQADYFVDLVDIQGDIGRAPLSAPTSERKRFAFKAS